MLNKKGHNCINIEVIVVKGHVLKGHDEVVWWFKWKGTSFQDWRDVEEGFSVVDIYVAVAA